ncbi:MAG: efflux RND transporter permease subunit, partial [Bacteroidota bacterium]
VIATLAASLLIAVTLTPFLASILLKERSVAPAAQQSTAPTQKGTFVFRQMQRFVEGPYRRIINLALRNRTLTLVFAVASFVGAMMLFPYVGVSFFPKAEKPQFRITINLPKGSNIDATNEAVRYVESVLEKRDEVAYYASNVGHGNPRIYYNIFPANFASTTGEVLVILKQYEVDAFYRLLDELRVEFSSYTRARINVREFVQGPPSEAPIALKIYGENLDKLEAYAKRVEDILQNNPGAINVDNALATRNTDLYFKVNRDKAMMLGVPTFAVDKTIRTFVNGSTVATFRDQNAEEYNMVMRYDFEDQFELEDFEQVQVQSLNGHFIPLRQLASMEFAEAPSTISHLNTDRVATLLADVAVGRTLDEVAAEVTDELEKIDWEEGYSYQFKGELQNREESFGGLGVASIIALILILGVLIIQFKSFV